MKAKTWLDGGPPDPARRAEHERFQRVDGAFKAGDLAALCEVLGEPATWLESVMPPAIGPSLEYAIYHSPISFIERLLELGANPNPEDHQSFPPLIAALSCSNDHPGAKARPDVLDILELLLWHGADPGRRGLNDCTALHMAVAERNAPAVDLLLRHGADPTLRTRIDDAETPREMAEAGGLTEIAKMLGVAEASRTNA